MSYQNFTELLDKAREMPTKRLSVAAAHDKYVLKAVSKALEDGLKLEFTLVGDEEKINKNLQNLQLADHEAISVVHATDDKKAAELAVKEVSQGDSDYLMKGMVSTKPFLKQVLNEKYGLRTGRILSHVGAFEISTYPRVFFITDGGINPEPSLDDKKEILQNAVDFVNALGVQEPKAAVLGAVENINPEMDATLDAAALTLMQQRGQIRDAQVDGPLALDNAIDEQAARHKGITSPVAGKADILLTPNIESGNLLAKSITFLGQGTMAGMVVGAKVPIVLTSRADSVHSKITSMALGALATVEK